jgi:hypothetical protein
VGTNNHRVDQSLTHHCIYSIHRSTSPYRRVAEGFGVHASGCHRSLGPLLFGTPITSDPLPVTLFAPAWEAPASPPGSFGVVADLDWALGFSRRLGWFAHLSSAMRARTLKLCIRATSCCCSAIDGGALRTCRSHWCHCAAF